LTKKEVEKSSGEKVCGGGCPLLDKKEKKENLVKQSTAGGFRTRWTGCSISFMLRMTDGHKPGKKKHQNVTGIKGEEADFRNNQNQFLLENGQEAEMDREPPGSFVGDTKRAQKLLHTAGRKNPDRGQEEP